MITCAKCTELNKTRSVGEALRDYTCAECGCVETHGNTGVPKICGLCASINNKCQDCGADLPIRK